MAPIPLGVTCSRASHHPSIPHLTLFFLPDPAPLAPPAMTPASTSPLAATAAARPKPFSRIYPLRLTRVSCQATPDRPSLRDNASNALPAPQPRWRLAVSAALAAAVVTATPAYADLNKFEAEQRGEFGIGSAAQYGSADLKYALSLVHSPCSSYCIGFFILF
jgi:hypothetical protein